MTACKSRDFIKPTKKYFLTLVIFIILLISFTACSAEATPEDFVFDWEAENPFYGQTLTISAVYDSHQIREHAIMYMGQNPGVTIEVTDHHLRFNNAVETVSVQLMAGTADTLICASLLDLTHPATSRMFTDWWPIILSDTRLNINDFNTNALYAFSQKGRLYAFPMHIIYDFVAVNNTVPGLAEAFAELEFITMQDLQRLHDEFSPDYMTMHNNHDALYMMRLHLDNFVDIENGLVDFNNQEFISLITQARDTASIRRQFGLWNIHAMLPGSEAESRQTYSFLTHLPPSLFQFIAPDQGRPFSDARPMANETGELRAYPMHAFAINAAASPTEKALAWDFIRFMQDPVNMLREIPLGTSIYRRNTHRWVYHVVLHHYFLNWANISEAEVIDYALALFNTIADTPHINTAVIPNIHEDFFYDTPNIIWNNIREVLHQFHDGLITAEQAAETLQNRLTLVLMEMD